MSVSWALPQTPALATVIQQVEEKKRIAALAGFPLGQLLAEWDGDVPRVAQHLFECDREGKPTRPRHRAWTMTIASWKPVTRCYAAWFHIDSPETLYSMWCDLVDALLLCGLDQQADQFRAWVYGTTCKWGLMQRNRSRSQPPLASAVPVVGYDPENPGFN